MILQPRDSATFLQLTTIGPHFFTKGLRAGHINYHLFGVNDDPVLAVGVLQTDILIEHVFEHQGWVSLQGIAVAAAAGADGAVAVAGAGLPRGNFGG